MIGNDLIDLQLAKTQSNWRRKGFLSKQFTEEEQHQIFTSKNPFLQVWLFWSMKEAAYKCHVQKCQKLFFAPLKFSCKMVSKTEGTIIFQDEIFYSNSLISENYIHTLVSENQFLNCFSTHFLIDENSHQNNFLLEQIRSHFPEVDSIQKNAVGVPFLINKNEKLPFSLSISHHGNYAGFAITENTVKNNYLFLKI